MRPFVVRVVLHEGVYDQGGMTPLGVLIQALSQSGVFTRIETSMIAATAFDINPPDGVNIGESYAWAEKLAEALTNMHLNAVVAPPYAAYGV